ncbi:DNA polymerase III subunit gamma/tau, partial [Burkholderia multivorans]
PTIISRAQRFDFKAISLDQIIDRLRYVAESQHIEFDEEAIAFIAKASEGGMRDALSIMDQAIAFGDEHLTLQDALNVTGSVDEASLNALLNDVANGEVKAAFARYHQFIEDGKVVNRLINDLIYFVRDTIMNKTAQNQTEYDALMGFDFDTLYKMIDLINDTLVSVRFSVNQNVHFEVLLVKLAELIKAGGASKTSEPQTSMNQPQATQTAGANDVNSALLQRLEHLEQELHALKQQGVPQVNTPPKQHTASRGRRKSKNSYSMT